MSSIRSAPPPPRPEDPPAPSPGPATLDAQRFWSVLRLRSSEQRRTSTTLPGALACETPGEATHEHGDETTDTQALPAGSTTPPRPRSDGARTGRPVPPPIALHEATAEAAPASGEDTQERRSGSTTAATAAADAADDGTAAGWQRLAERIKRLYQRGAAAVQSWDVTIDLDPTVLPDTRLQMQGSREDLRLRFLTHSSLSAGLVLTHAPTLRRTLERELDLDGHVDVELQ